MPHHRLIGHMRTVMTSGMMASMTNVKFATAVPAAAVEAARAMAAQDGLPIGEVIGRAVLADAIRRGTRALHDALDRDPDLAAEWANRRQTGEIDAADLRYPTAA